MANRATPTNDVYDTWKGIEGCVKRGYLKNVDHLYDNHREEKQAVVNYSGFALMARRNGENVALALIMMIPDDSNSIETKITTHEDMARITMRSYAPPEHEVQLRVVTMNLSIINFIKFVFGDHINIVTRPGRCSKWPGSTDNHRATPLVLSNTGLNTANFKEQAMVPAKNKDMSLYLQMSDESYMLQLEPFNAGDKLNISNPQYVRPMDRPTYTMAISTDIAQFDSDVQDERLESDCENNCDDLDGQDTYSCTLSKGVKDSVQGGTLRRFSGSLPYSTTPFKVTFDRTLESRIFVSNLKDVLNMMPGGMKFSCKCKVYKIHNGNIRSAVITMNCCCIKGHTAEKVIGYLEGRLDSMTSAEKCQR